MRPFKQHPIALFPLILLALTAFGCHRGGGKDAAANAPPPPIVLGPEDTAVVVRAPIQSGPALTGTLAAEQQATVRAQLSGSVLEVLAEPGQTVRRGQVLARLDSASLTEIYTSAQAAVTNARNNLAFAERELERQRALVAAGAVAQRNVETAQQQVVAARAALAQARSQVANAEKQLGYTRVKAPFSGVVSERPVAGGDVVQPGTALFTIVDPSSLQLEAAIPAEQIGSLGVGVPVEFNVTGYTGRIFRGRITRINPAADPATRQVRVYAEIPNPGNDLVSGLYAEGRVESESRTALTVPSGAIDRRMSKPAVLRVRDGKVERVEVVLGLVDDREQRVEVQRGVAAGDVVLMGASQEIQPGTPVRLAPSVQQQAERLAQAL
ncbi:MAG TPA: efflux RND transporter periplasmic adaptor subunit [Thermoanaerobaculia bacterium]|jgi:RND family efflux transporter MFP subunit|nr:efflux RND transporter periplasmic adaptor subunit [Thermoanaerobaculia bacterium]